MQYNFIKIGKSFRHIIALLTLLALAGGQLRAQQDLTLSQQLFSRINVNPAGTGNNDKFDVFLLGRFQWAGVDNGPKTGLLNFTGYSEKLKSSAGVSLSYDNIGIGHSTTNLKAVYAYHLDLSPKYLLSSGISGVSPHLLGRTHLDTRPRQPRTDVNVGDHAWT